MSRRFSRASAASFSRASEAFSLRNNRFITMPPRLETKRPDVAHDSTGDALSGRKAGGKVFQDALHTSRHADSRDAVADFDITDEGGRFGCRVSAVGCRMPAPPRAES